MTDKPPITRTWVLVAPAVDPEDVQGRAALYWNAEDQEWVESPDEASEFSDAERVAFELGQVEGDVEWWERQAS